MNAINNTDYKRNSLIKIKSSYILNLIFDNLKQKKILEIIRYNGNLKNKLNKIKKDYIKEYYKIELDIIPIKNKYGNFININNN